MENPYITPDIVGKSFNEIKGNCNIEKTYGFDSSRQNWVVFPLDEDFHRQSIMLGIAVKVSNDCNLGSTGGTEGVSPPSLPNGGTQSTTGCRDSDGGLDYTESGTISGIEVSRIMNEKLIREGTRYDGLEVLSETMAKLKLSEVTNSKEVSVGNTYTFNYGRVHINDLDFFGIGDSRNNAEITVVGVTDFLYFELRKILKLKRNKCIYLKIG